MCVWCSFPATGFGIFSERTKYYSSKNLWAFVNYPDTHMQSSLTRAQPLGGQRGQDPPQIWTDPPTFHMIRSSPTLRSKILELPLPQYPPLSRLSHHQWPNLPPNFYSVVAPLIADISCQLRNFAYFQYKVKHLEIRSVCAWKLSRSTWFVFFCVPTMCMSCWTVIIINVVIY